MFMLREFSWKLALINFSQPKLKNFLSVFVYYLKKTSGFTWKSQLQQERETNNALTILNFVLPSQHTKVMEY